jgi:hypothetical protein
MGSVIDINNLIEEKKRKNDKSKFLDCRAIINECSGKVEMSSLSKVEMSP